MTILSDLLPRLPDPAQPLFTFDDRTTGERVELSGTTTANWVAKTSNFLVDELDAEPGTRVRIGLPSHWLRFVWVLSCWSVGAVLVETGADVGVSGPDLVADEEHRVAASLRPLGARFPQPPEGFHDLGAEVPGQGDVFVPLDPVAPTAPAVDLGSLVGSHQDLLESATPVADRILVEPRSLAEEIPLLVDVLLGGGSLVLVVGGSPDTLQHIAVQERALRR